MGRMAAGAESRRAFSWAHMATTCRRRTTSIRRGRRSASGRARSGWGRARPSGSSPCPGPRGVLAPADRHPTGPDRRRPCVCRHWIEQGFRGLKRGGWQWRRTRRRVPRARGLAPAGRGLRHPPRGNPPPRPVSGTVAVSAHRGPPGTPSAPRQPAAAGLGLSAAPAGPQPSLGPGLADPGAGVRLGRWPALSLVPWCLKSLPVPQSRAPEAAPARMPDPDPVSGPVGRVRVATDAHHGLPNTPEYPDRTGTCTQCIQKIPLSRNHWRPAGGDTPIGSIPACAGEPLQMQDWTPGGSIPACAGEPLPGLAAPVQAGVEIADGRQITWQPGASSRGECSFAPARKNRFEHTAMARA